MNTQDKTQTASELPEEERAKWTDGQFEILSDMAQRILKLEKALRILVDVNERIGPPMIRKGTLCEEEDWASAMRSAEQILKPVPNVPNQ